MERKVLAKAMVKTERQERKVSAPKGESLLKRQLEPVKAKISEKIPDKAIALTEAAFVKGFTMVFEQGQGVIAKSFDGDKHRAIYRGYEAMLDDGEIEASLKGIEKAAKASGKGNKILTTAEGGLLGLLGIGLPDIPIYIGVLLKTVYEIALSYGFNYEDDGERAFILNVIAMAAVSDERRSIYSQRIDRIGQAIDEGRTSAFQLEPVIAGTAKLLTERLVAAKFVQGLPIVGVVGAATNYQFLAELSKVAQLKYKKRFLRKIEQKEC